jgi:hypothetical protein
MKNPLLPDPVTHPRLYAREYQRLRPLLADLGLVLGLLACPAVAWGLYWVGCLAFAL